MKDTDTEFFEVVVWMGSILTILCIPIIGLLVDNTVLKVGIFCVSVVAGFIGITASVWFITRIKEWISRSYEKDSVNGHMDFVYKLIWDKYTIYNEEGDRVLIREYTKLADVLSKSIDKYPGHGERKNYKEQITVIDSLAKELDRCFRRSEQELGYVSDEWLVNLENYLHIVTEKLDDRSRECKKQKEEKREEKKAEVDKEFKKFEQTLDELRGVVKNRGEEWTDFPIRSVEEIIKEGMEEMQKMKEEMKSK